MDQHLCWDLLPRLFGISRMDLIQAKLFLKDLGGPSSKSGKKQCFNHESKICLYNDFLGDSVHSLMDWLCDCFSTDCDSLVDLQVSGIKRLCDLCLTGNSSYCDYCISDLAGFH